MILSSILIGDRSWVIPMLLIMAGTFAILWAAYRAVGSTPGVRLTAGLLKAFGFAILAFCLVEPLWSGMRARSGENIFVVLADNSQSMTIRDANSTQTRAELLSQLLKLDPKSKQPSWRTRLAQDFDVREYSFDAGLQRCEEISAIKFDGLSTSLERQLTLLQKNFHGQPLGGILLLTDGCMNDFAELDVDWDQLPPIYPVVLAGNKIRPDIAIKNVSISQTAFEDAPVSIRVDVSATGYSGQSIVAQVLSEAGEVVNQETQQADDDVPLAFRFQIRPKKLGVLFYQLRVFAEGTEKQFDAPDSSDEATLVNNQRWVHVDRGSKNKHRVLYVCGRPNWEFKFLRRAVEDDEQVDLVGLIRVAKREAKFDFRGRDGETSNSIFRGFKKDGDEETEDYDQPVLVRLNTKDDAELRDGFPKSEDELFQFDAVILDDLESSFLKPDQLSLLEKFVSVRGGGLLMLGGQESFEKGKYRRTPIGEMLPVYLDRAPKPVPGSRFQLQLTREGWLQPWIRLRGTEVGERARLKSMPEFRTLNHVRNIKPGATVLATVVDSNRRAHPALVVQRFGRGRVGALLIGDFWRWQLKRQDANVDDQAKAWRQMVRWLVADVPEKVEIEYSKQLDVSETAISFKLRLRNDKFEPLENATVRFTIHKTESTDDSTTHTPGQDKQVKRDSVQQLSDRDAAELAEVKIEAEASLQEAGLYEATFVPRKSGSYRATVEVTDIEGRSVGSRQIGWISEPLIAEFDKIEPNRALMRQLAEKTGGEVIAVNRLNRFTENLSARSMPVSEQWTFPIWDQPWVFMLALGCLVGEWGLRRWKGLP